MPTTPREHHDRVDESTVTGGGETPAVEESTHGPVREPVSHRLYVLVAWGTLQGLPLLAPRIALLLEGDLIRLARRLDVEPLEVSAEADRVRLLLRFKPSQPIGPVALRLKDGADAAVRGHDSPVRWGRGWAAATVPPGAVRDLRRRLAARSIGARRLTVGLRDG